MPISSLITREQLAMFHRPESMRTQKRFLRSFGSCGCRHYYLALQLVPAVAATLTPLATFGGGDGWLAPGEYEDYPYLLNT